MRLYSLLFAVLFFVNVGMVNQAIARNCGETGNIPYTGKILGISVSAYSTAYEGGGFIELTMDNKAKYTLTAITTGQQDNSGSAMTAFYHLAEMAYLHDLPVTISEYRSGTFVGCTLAIKK